VQPGRPLQPRWDRIAAIDDPVLRNLWITQRYHELAVALRDWAAGPDATWCAFAVWASKTAGSVIRGDDLPAAIRRLAGERAGDSVDRFNREAPRLAPVAGSIGDDHLARFAERVANDVSADIAAGNLAVFVELAPAFESLVTAWDSGPQAAFSSARAALAQGSQATVLQAAFDAYRQGFAADAASVRRAPLLLAANVLTVAHEQQRLQPAITAALDAAVYDTLQLVLERDILRHLPGLFRRPLDRLVDDLAAVLEDACRVAVTQTMLCLVTSDERLDLCLDVPPLAGVMWPVGLAALGSDGAPFWQWDRTGGTGRPTAVSDWDDLAGRMNYIVNLFRSRQRHPPLLDPPFDAAQLSDLRAGRRPAAPL